MYHILIAEDDVNIAYDLTTCLQAEGFATAEVYDGTLAESITMWCWILLCR